MHLAKKEPIANAQINPAESSVSKEMIANRLAPATGFSKFNIRELIKHVNDYLDTPYVNEDGIANYGVYIDSGIGRRDILRFAHYEEARRSKVQYEQLAYHGSPHSFTHFEFRCN